MVGVQIICFLKKGEKRLYSTKKDMAEKIKITEIKETHTQSTRVRTEPGEAARFEERNVTRYKEVPYVEGWARFGAFLLDIIFIIIFEAIIGLTLGVFLGLIGQIDVVDSSGFDLTFRVFTLLVIRPFYYILFEGSMQATPAKLILGRVVVNEYGEKPSLKQIIARSYSRIVPFEFFSCLSTLGWHDTWSDTFVLRKKDLHELKLAVKAHEFGEETPTNLT